MITLLCIDCGRGHDVDEAALYKGAGKTLLFVCRECAEKLREIEDSKEDLDEG